MLDIGIDQNSSSYKECEATRWLSVLQQREAKQVERKRQCIERQREIIR
jgi:hypothetical protein